MADTDRRTFITGTAQVAIAAGAASILAASAEAHEEAPSGAKREVVPGSPSPAYSRATRVGNLVYVAGCVGNETKDGKSHIDPDFKVQARQTILNLKSSVEAAGSSLDRVLKCTCFLKEYADFKAFNEIYMSIFPEPRPARSTVVVKDFVVPGALLEVDCICVA